MKKTFLKIFASLSLLSIGAYGAYLYACADDGWGFGNSLFAPEIMVKKPAYKPLFFDSSNLFYQGDYIDRASGDYSHTDLEQWKQYLGKTFWKEGIQYFMYDKNSLADIHKYNASPDKAKVSLSQHTPKVDDKRLRNFFSFLAIARGNEHITNVTYDPWDYDSHKVERTQQNEISKAESLYRKALADKDVFFANRMWFQVARLKFYSYDRGSVITFFNDTQEKQPKNSLYYRALHYVAGAYIAQKNYAKSNALLATLASAQPEQMTTFTYEYHPLTDRQVSQIATTLSQQQQCALWAMQGYYTDEVTAIEHIRAIDPFSSQVDFLLTRYINRIEDKVNVFGEYGEKIKSAADYHQHTQALLNRNFRTDWLIEVAQEGKVASPYLWKVAAAYILIFKKDNQEARILLQQAEKIAKDTPQQAQIRLLDIFNEVTALERITPADEERLLKRLEWMWNSSLLKSDKEQMRSFYLFSFVRYYLSALYKEENNTLMAELLSPTLGYYDSLQQSVTMENLLLKKEKTPWEAFWTDNYRFSLGEIYESRAIYAFYQGDINKAILELEKAPLENVREYDSNSGKMVTKKRKISQAVLPANPFNGYIKDCNDCQHQAKQRVTYTTLSFLKKVKEMQEKIAQGEEIYNNALLLGNAFYNASYFGSIRAFYCNRILNEYGGLGVNRENYERLLSMKNAEKYYLIAQQHAKDDEQRAKIAYMLAKVERNNYYNQVYFYQDRWYGVESDEIAFKDWEGFRELRERYAHTQYYKEVIKECEYFRKTVRK